jgi:hypothetical protein
MAEADWTAFTAATNQGLDSGDVSKGVTDAFDPPNGGGNFVCGFNSLQATIGFAGWYYSVLPAFNPIAPNKGGSIRAAIRRYASGIGYAPMIGLIAGTNLSNTNAYILGLSNSDPYQLVLRKGYITSGLDPTAADVLRVSDASWSVNTKWLDLRLDVIVNPQHDVVLNVYQNDLDANPVTAPNWVAIDGMDSFVDDSNAILTGTAPLVSGLRGFFGHFNDGLTGKVSLFDQLELYRQLSP